MNIKEAKARFGEKLDEIEDLNESAHAHYLRIEAAVSRASAVELQEYYARVHGIMPEDVIKDSRFPWHPEYNYGNGKKCCENCQELEMALAVNLINEPADRPLVQAFPRLAEALTPPSESARIDQKRNIHGIYF